MASKFNIFGAWNHLQDQNAAGRGVQYNKVNILGGLYRYEKGLKTDKGAKREKSIEQSFLFGAAKYSADRANGVSHTKMSFSFLNMPLFKKETHVVKDGADYFKNTSTKIAFIPMKYRREWQQNGHVMHTAMPKDVNDKLKHKEDFARSVYGDHMNGHYKRPRNLRKYAMEQSLNEKAGPNLNNASVQKMTTGGVLKMLHEDVSYFQHIMMDKEVADSKKRKFIYKVTGVLSVLPMVVGFASSTFAIGGLGASFIGVTAAVLAYDKIKEQGLKIAGKRIGSVNAKTHAELAQTKAVAVQSVIDYEKELTRLGPQANLDQSAIVNAFEDLHRVMEKKQNSRKTENKVETAALGVASVGVGVAMAHDYPGINAPGIASGALGLLYTGARYQQTQEQTEKTEILVSRFGNMIQELTQSKLVLPPPKPTNGTGGPTGP